MIPTDPEARIYLVLLGILAFTVLGMIVVTRSAQKQADRADLRARILRSQLDGAQRALDWWKMTDRQRRFGIGPYKLDPQATSAAGDRELESPAEAPAVGVHKETKR